jgi:glycosyltransferase involved in cell wall biosynthesis
MNILYIVPNPPSLVRVRPYNLIRHLRARGHCVTIATVWANAGEQDDIKALRTDGLKVIAAPLSRQQIILNLLRALATGRPLQAEYSWQPGLKAQISDVESQFDVVHIEHLRGARFGLALKAQAPVVWDSVDCITYLFEQASRQSQSVSGKLMTWFELGRTRRHEGWLVNQFDQVLVTSPTDKSALESIANIKSQISNLRHPIEVLPNGVDLEYFTPGTDARQPETIVFSGKMSYHANITAALYLAHQVMPLVWAQQPNARLIIAGSQPSPAIRKLAETYPSRVQVTGYLSDLRAPLRQASVAAAPLLYGAGIQNKVLEAMACGTPVVASALAVSALQAQPDQDCLVANSPQTFAQASLALLHDPALRERVGAAGRHYVERQHDWNTIAAQLESIYEKSMRNVH